MEYILKTSNLTKVYGKKNMVLDSVSMNVPKGSIYGFVGKNGAGKTTLMRVISGLNSPTRGSYSICGIDHKDSAIINTRQKIGAVVETPSIYLDMTARDNLLLQYKLHGLAPDKLNEILELVGLPNTGKKRRKTSHSVCGRDLVSHFPLFPTRTSLFLTNRSTVLIPRVSWKSVIFS